MQKTALKISLLPRFAIRALTLALAVLLFPSDADAQIKMEFVWCPPGVFTMGSPENEEDRKSDETQERIEFETGFWIGKFEVTQAQWEDIMGDNPSETKGANLPVHNVSRTMIREFLSKVNAVLQHGMYWALPTEEQWEYANRAGTKDAYSFGNDASKLGAYAWFADNSYGVIHEVGKKSPNKWGIHDMHGNVAEICASDYEVGGNAYLLIRGGSYLSAATAMRSAARDFGNRTDDHAGVFAGFRVVSIMSCPDCGANDHVDHPVCSYCSTKDHTSEQHPACMYCKKQAAHAEELCSQKPCAFCGKTGHTTVNHPRCRHCGQQAYHADADCSKRPCSYCGSTSHSTHPTCSYCGSEGHASYNHPTCKTCGSKEHTFHYEWQSAGVDGHGLYLSGRQGRFWQQVKFSNTAYDSLTFKHDGIGWGAGYQFGEVKKDEFYYWYIGCESIDFDVATLYKRGAQNGYDYSYLGSLEARYIGLQLGAGYEGELIGVNCSVGFGSVKTEIHEIEDGTRNRRRYGYDGTIKSSGFCLSLQAGVSVNLMRNLSLEAAGYLMMLPQYDEVGSPNGVSPYADSSSNELYGSLIYGVTVGVRLTFF